MNDLSDEDKKNKRTKKRKSRNEADDVEDEDDGISLSTTDSDHEELLKIIKKRKLAKLKTVQQSNSLSTSGKYKKHDETSTIVSNDGSMFQRNIQSHHVSETRYGEQHHPVVG